VNRSAIALAASLSAAILGLAQSSDPGRANYTGDANSAFDHYTYAPNSSLQQWFQTHFSGMVVYPPYFDQRTSWYPHAYAYIDLYAIYPGTWEQAAHPEWILHDQNGNSLYIPYGCSGGTCTQYAGDISNPGFRADWIDWAKSSIASGHYPGLFIDDVNMEFRVTDGWGNPAAPIDSNTGKSMTYDAWRNYLAGFLEQIRASLPGTKLIENSIWYAGPGGMKDADPAIQRQIATADIVCLERGVANDPGLTGGTGFWSVYSFFDYIDHVHAAGKGVFLKESNLDSAGQQYGLASYFMISNGNDSIGDAVTTPDYWWHGYDVDLGAPLGPRTYKGGIFERDFAGGKVLLGEPGLAPQTVDLGGAYTTLDGNPVTSATIAGRQGLVLLSAAPDITVVNGASQVGGPISPGEVVTLRGSFSNSSPVILFNGVAVPVTYASAKQANAIAPFGLDLGNPAQIQIGQGSAGGTVSMQVAAASPAIFSQNGSGTGPGAILNQDYSVNSPSIPAAPGSVIMVYGTGFGALGPLPADGQIVAALATTRTPVTASIDGVPAEVLYAGAAPGLIAGVVQINIRIPSVANANPAAPVLLSMGSFTTQAGVTVAIH